MGFPATALQGALYSALSGASGVTTALGGSGHIHDRVPEGAVFPYITIGKEQIVDDSNTCDHDAVEAFPEVHIWSRKAGSVEAKTIAGAVHDALNKEITITGFRNVVGSFESAIFLDDPDGLTTHGVVTFRYLIDPA